MTQASTNTEEKNPDIEFARNTARFARLLCEQWGIPLTINSVGIFSCENEEAVRQGNASQPAFQRLPWGNSAGALPDKTLYLSLSLPDFFQTFPDRSEQTAPMLAAWLNKERKEMNAVNRLGTGEKKAQSEFDVHYRNGVLYVGLGPLRELPKTISKYLDMRERRSFMKSAAASTIAGLATWHGFKGMTEPENSNLRKGSGAVELVLGSGIAINTGSDAVGQAMRAGADNIAIVAAHNTPERWKQFERNLCSQLGIDPVCLDQAEQTKTR